MRILNLYACLGGNRYKWGDEHEITAVERDPELARLYKERFPNDNVIIGDAHKYLLNHYKEFDFIWSSPPCPSHSSIRVSQKNRDSFIPLYPDMKLYQEIILLQNFFKGKYCVENVIPYYDPLIPAQKRGRHLYWTNFKLPTILSTRKQASNLIESGLVSEICAFHEIDISTYKGSQRKDKIARNLVDFEAGKTILDTALGIEAKKSVKQFELFNQLSN